MYFEPRHIPALSLIRVSSCGRSVAPLMLLSTDTNEVGSCAWSPLYVSLKPEVPGRSFSCGKEQGQVEVTFF